MPLTLLIVEDHPAMRALIRTVVAPLADTVHECDNGAEAAHAYAAHRPDLVLMDLVLPGLDGIAATEAVRRLDPEARVVIVTDHDAGELRARAARAGACGYLLKEQLLDVRALLRDAALNGRGCDETR